MKIQTICVSLMLLFLAGCKVIPISQQGNKKPTPVVVDYDEDLSSVRPRYNVSTISLEPKYETSPLPETAKPAKTTSSEISMHVNAQVAAVLDTMAARNKNIKYADGYKIQIYVGNVRADVESAKTHSYQIYPELSPYMTFNQPTYRLKVGDFMSRSDAENYLITFRQQYPGATIVADKIELKKSILIR